MLSKETVSRWATELGFAEVGFCSPTLFEQARRTVESQPPLAERRQLRFDPCEDYPDTKSIAVLLWPYQPAKDCEPGEVFVDSYYQASNAAYHAARVLEGRILEAGCFAKANVSYPAKEAALRAQMGVIGVNSLLITPQYGSRVVIILMATEIELDDESNDDTKKNFCIECGRCVQACPVQAITEEGMLHPERCLRNFMMEGVVIPEHLRSKLDMRLIGCDICQRVCPMQPGMEHRPSKTFRLSSFMTENSAAFSAAVSDLAEEIGRNAARPQRVRAQAALLAGNSKDPAYLPVLKQWALLPFAAVREHAAWAIRQLEAETPNTGPQYTFRVK